MQIYHEGKIVRLLEAIAVYAGDGGRRSIDAERASIIIKVLSCNWSSFEVEDEGFLQFRLHGGFCIVSIRY